MPSSSSIDASGAVAPSRSWTGRGCPEDFASFLRTQGEVDAVCKNLGVPKQFAAIPAGDLRASSTPPPGAICVHMRSLEAGMEVPPRGFFREALAHFGIAPAQLTPNGWRIMAGFLALCRSSGVPPSLAVFRYFFLLSPVCKMQRKGYYSLRSRDSSGLLFTGFPFPNLISFKYWKHKFFFLSSPEPWPCPVEWGEPPKGSLEMPVLAGEHKKSAAKLFRAHGGAAVDLGLYLCSSSPAAARAAPTCELLPPPPVPSSSSSLISVPEGMDPSVYAMMKTMLAEKAAAQDSASAKKVKAEPDTVSPGLCGKKRTLEVEAAVLSPAPSMLNTELSSGICSPPPGFLSRVHDGDGTGRVDIHIREQLEEGKREHASAKRDAELEKAKAELAEANVGLAAAEVELVTAKAELAAAKLAADAEQEKERPELCMEVSKAKAKLAAAKRALEEELENAKGAALRLLLRSEEHVRRRAERALERYQRWRTGPAPAGPAA